MGRQEPEGLLGIQVNLLAGAIGIQDQLPAKSEQEPAAHDAGLAGLVGVCRAVNGRSQTLARMRAGSREAPEVGVLVVRRARRRSAPGLGRGRVASE